jgi:hypothetical protein
MYHLDSGTLKTFRMSYILIIVEFEKPATLTLGQAISFNYHFAALTHLDLSNVSSATIASISKIKNLESTKLQNRNYPLEIKKYEYLRGAEERLTALINNSTFPKKIWTSTSFKRLSFAALRSLMMCQRLHLYYTEPHYDDHSTSSTIT